MSYPTLDVPDASESPLFGLFAKFGLAIDSLTQQIKRANSLEQQRLAQLPNYYSFSKMSSPGAAVTDLVDMGGPQPGRMWTVRLLVAIASPDAANATKVIWYVGQRMPGPAAGMLPATMARWQMASVPNFSTFTSDIIKILPGELLIAGLTSIPASSNIALTAAVNDQPISGQSAAVTVIE